MGLGHVSGRMDASDGQIMLHGFNTITCVDSVALWLNSDTLWILKINTGNLEEGWTNYISFVLTCGHQRSDEWSCLHDQW